MNQESNPSIDLDRVVDMGVGPNAVLFLHGLFGTPDHYREVMENLSSQYRVIAPQLPIDPQPGRRKRGMKSVADLSEVVAQFVDELELDRFVLCGNSLGGLVAIDLCVRHPDFAEGLILAGSAGLFERSPIRGLRSRPTREFVRKTVTGILYNDSLVSEELVDHWYQSVMDRDYVRFLLRVSRATRDRSVEEELGSLDLPTMIIWGSDDEITPPSTGEDFKRLIHGSKLEFIDQCGHAPNWEQPAAFTRLLESFLPECFA
ncbi:alpha/beta fold hydrolase [Novipirellula artificiosorum]|uniref:2-hydroxy-6-oxo-6-phenylhexa-2,4-dienoate hydrolase n=1 Tax=Novipirellula artificiosorum TaxID=2528016 RepID=A0A5C6DWI6_9BACT|nr:alpha/beta hydrolase [Novipirellula artificiosorum]TWU41763.1 2-hydroxy-6-oxo-6-phenylhexa-2,4-dienoate hydrolase [Novipirellula artificiosorum]